MRTYDEGQGLTSSGYQSQYNSYVYFKMPIVGDTTAIAVVRVAK